MLSFNVRPGLTSRSPDVRDYDNQDHRHRCKVREVYFNFPLYAEWCREHISDISCTSPYPSTSNSSALVSWPPKGATVKLSVKGLTVNNEVLESRADYVSWVGSAGGVPGVFTSLNSFGFESSTIIPGGTRFVKTETFSGALAWMMRPSVGGKNLEASQEKFLANLKARVESVHKR
ncbi:hypothetical protein FRB94_009284 [Tulasnella sp. JGI-2019a]|nr:hypothetical protein FRB94_009284 [Tulasnella sp. JGI-2019a]KAG9000143.1 hypothetical protein FRB93_012818 [Tulasnella sp. JGI-2019a]KAG9026476.1 hypothetical protein FRB95_008815 [Tulasnella sp. JGI-2019a]